MTFPPDLTPTLLCRVLFQLALLAAGSLPTLAGETGGPSPLSVAAEPSVSVPGATRIGDTLIMDGDVLTIRVATWDLLQDKSLDWVGVSGTYAVQEDGTIMVPFADNVAAAGRAPAEIAQDVSVALRATTGVQAPPAVVVEISRRLPVYVSGDVTMPGEVEFRERLTVRQAIALAGGPLRTPPGSGTDFLGRLAQNREAILRADLRIARLEAELSRATNFDVPAGIDESMDLESLVSVERRLMQAREDALAAQTASVDELIDVLTRVKSGLEEQISLVQADLERAQEELNRKQDLLEGGLTREVDVSNAETSLSNLRLRQVDMNTQYLNLEKDLSEAQRSRDTLSQAREIEILQELSQVRDHRRDLEIEAAFLSPALAMSVSENSAMILLLIRAGSTAPEPVDPEMQLRPGDTLILETEVG